MSGTITLPREAVEKALKSLESWHKAVIWQKDHEAAITALRTALAAEQPKPKPEPVAWQERHLFPGMGEWTNWYDHQRPRLAHHPLEEVHDRVRYQFRPLYTAPPDAEALRRDAERYRYLRNRDPKEVFNKSGKAAGVWIDWEDDLSGLQLLTGDDADAAIDAAMKEDKR